MVDRRFEGQVAVVTGGSRGFGRAVAVRLAREGADVAFTWCTSRTSADETLKEIHDVGSRGIAVRALLKDREAPARLVEQAREELGEPTLVVSNAASGAAVELRDATETQWDWTFETNGAAFLRLMQAADNARSVVVMTSLGAERVFPRYGLIGASKAALEQLARNFAVELAPQCRVNAIHAGISPTKSLERLPRSDEVVAESLKATPAGRLVEPDDVGSLAAFLLSDEASMITGQTVVVDGGFSVLAYSGLPVSEWFV